jgi:hypothetical protein
VLGVASWRVRVRVHTNISSHRQRNANISQVRFRLSSFVALSFSPARLEHVNLHEFLVFPETAHCRAGREVVFAPRPSVELPVLPLHV